MPAPFSFPLKCLREALYLWITYRLILYLGYPSTSKSTIATTASIYFTLLLVRRHISQRRCDQPSEAYGLQHALLNHASNSRELWCNMGYWSTATTFTTANLDLLGLLANNADLHPGRRDTVLDLGTGCGTQSIHLLKSYKFESYTSITSHPAQHSVAKRDLLEGYGTGGTRIRVVLGDAANPPPEILSESYTKILALDCAYHFPAPRHQFFERVFGLLEHVGTFALTDIILGDTPSLLEKLKMRALCVVLGVPWANMIPLSEYKTALYRAGFAIDDIDTVDITDDVFAPFAAWIMNTAENRTESGWRMYKIFARVLRWWASSGVVRVIVVRARKGPLHPPSSPAAIITTGNKKEEEARGGSVQRPSVPENGNWIPIERVYDQTQHANGGSGGTTAYPRSHNLYH
ncbi:hypothetical protein G7K_4367-t1 [Saitoella complicata NRRL Y-17804]|uniref:Methyltransferase domain-containing protein n=2 Tax=Saitoella complicata (strain BCRC 22490 / CBS 7301 / JCM 7358 / NBRC 10748 / NRRL Y-17804) TaxID=698492 RepID=A0A0E9NLE5_SAICN|nr:hypothetical protein G7K_4367-t1 [Saitoella complicata NRRL Y-17804]